MKNETSLTKELFRKEVIRLREENRELMFKLAGQKAKIENIAEFETNKMIIYRKDWDKLFKGV